jgi:hypothetical protein
MSFSRDAGHLEQEKPVTIWTGFSRGVLWGLKGKDGILNDDHLRVDSARNGHPISLS